MLRFAVAPTEELSLNDLRIALLTYLTARAKGEGFVVRFEEGDRSRHVEGKDREILDILELFGLAWDDLHYQSRNLTIHQQLTVKLLSSRKAFACFCTPEELKGDRYDGRCEKLSDAEVLTIEKPFTIRIKKPVEPVKFEDLLQKECVFTPQQIDSFVILKTDKTPTHDFACAVDDMLLDIRFIIRQDREALDTARQIHVRDTLGYDRRIDYLHLPPLIASENEGVPGVQRLLKEGFFPEAIANYLIESALKTPKELFSLEEAIEWFDIEKLHTRPTPFDLSRLKWLNREHMKRMDAKELSRAFGFADASVGEVVKCHIDEASTVQELKPRIDAIFGPKSFEGAQAEAMREIQSLLQKAPAFDSFEELESYLTQMSALEGEALHNPLRALLTGFSEGPELNKLYPHLKSYIQEIIR